MPRTRVELASKPSLDDYDLWMRSRFRSAPIAKGRAHYETVVQLLERQIAASPFWKRLVSDYREWSSAYFMRTSYRMADGGPPQLQTKPWESFREKTYRKNVVANASWPDAPVGGWVLPPDWFSQVRDVVRTLMVVKYMDGVKVLVAHLEAVARELGCQVEVDFQAKTEGYYAAHVVVQLDARVPTVAFEEEERKVFLEVQVCTQLQEVIRQLLHSDYEIARLAPVTTDWQWDWSRSEFSVGYIGHVLHYLEGQIMTIRSRNDPQASPSDQE